VRHDGGGGDLFGTGSAGAVVRSDEAGCSSYFGGRRGPPGGSVHAHMRSSIGCLARGGRQPGGANVSVREGEAGWLGRPKVEVQW
jgi:hypothetical protein